MSREGVTGSCETRTETQGRFLQQPLHCSVQSNLCEVSGEPVHRKAQLQRQRKVGEGGEGGEVGAGGKGLTGTPEEEGEMYEEAMKPKFGEDWAQLTSKEQESVLEQRRRQGWLLDCSHNAMIGGRVNGRLVFMRRRRRV